MHLYDTRTRAVRPVEGAALRIYCCGPTVYRDAHVGNLRTFLLGDLIRRTAEAAGRQVTLVQNITDVGHMAADDDLVVDGEDKLLAAAQREGRDPFSIAREYEARFHADLAALNVIPADAYPRASDSIPLMVELIERLMAGGHAYVGGDGSVFFDARSFPGYGELSGNRLADLRPGHRVAGVDEAKRFHADWALWKRAGQRRSMVWDSPWGPGFPGWHIECSAMLLHHLGDSVDLHVGGIDLRFPHHEDERAQTDAAVGWEVVRHWVHGEHLLFEGRKMAKSAGNVVLLRDVTAAGLDPLALRLAFLGTRYRTQTDLSWEALRAADTRLRRWRELLTAWGAEPGSAGAAADAATAAVDAAFADDLDTPRALQELQRLERSDAPAADKAAAFRAADRVLGLDLDRPVVAAALPAEATELLAERAAARAERDWARSDALRDRLAELGVSVTDGPDGQRWQLAAPHPGTG